MFVFSNLFIFCFSLAWLGFRYTHFTLLLYATVNGVWFSALLALFFLFSRSNVRTLVRCLTSGTLTEVIQSSRNSWLILNVIAFHCVCFYTNDTCEWWTIHETIRGCLSIFHERAFSHFALSVVMAKWVGWCATRTEREFAVIQPPVHTIWSCTQTYMRSAQLVSVELPKFPPLFSHYVSFWVTLHNCKRVSEPLNWIPTVSTTRSRALEWKMHWSYFVFLPFSSNFTFELAEKFNPF